MHPSTTAAAMTMTAARPERGAGTGMDPPAFVSVPAATAPLLDGSVVPGGCAGDGGPNGVGSWAGANDAGVGIAWVPPGEGPEPSRPEPKEGAGACPQGAESEGCGVGCIAGAAPPSTTGGAGGAPAPASVAGAKYAALMDIARGVRPAIIESAVAISRALA